VDEDEVVEEEEVVDDFLTGLAARERTDYMLGC